MLVDQISCFRSKPPTWAKPQPLPESERLCIYCPDSLVDNINHFLFECNTFQKKKRCYLARMGCLIQDFNNLTDQAKLHTVLCPVSAVATKTTNKYMQILCRARQNIDQGAHTSTLTFPPQVTLYIPNMEDATINSPDSTDSMSSTNFSFLSLSSESEHDLTI